MINKIYDGGTHSISAANFVEEQTYQNQTVIAIAIDAVTNTLTGFDDKANQYTVVDMSNSVATGAGLSALYALGLLTFRVPFVRLSPQGTPDLKVYMVAGISEDGTFSMMINLPTGGEWVVNSELLNSELSDAELALFNFSIAEHKFKVV